MKLIEINAGWAVTYYPAHQIAKLTKNKSTGHWILRFIAEPTPYHLTPDLGESLKDWLITNERLYPLFEIFIGENNPPQQTLSQR